MIQSDKWDLITFRQPRTRRDDKPITELLGFDTEALSTGAPFIFCFSDGTSCKPKQFFQVLYDNYIGKDFAVYNLKYDSGAALFTIPRKNKIDLWEWGETFLENVLEVDNDKAQYTDLEEILLSRVYLTYFPHKNLRVSFPVGLGKKGKPVLHHVNFWDISQYYNMSLDAASKKYLNREKLDIETKKFTRLYVRENLGKIRKYCIHDAVLCADLGNHFLKKIGDTEVFPSALYSSAFLSAEYFKKRVGIISSWRYYKYYPEMMRAALDAYQGGKFEITARGRTYAYVYDLVSAYPKEISDLLDISFSEVIRDRHYREEASYGYLRCHVTITDNVHLTNGIMIKNNRVCPIGSYFITMTKREYDYYVSIGIDIDIIDAYWLIVGSRRYPYRDTVLELFKLKDKYKKSDILLTNVYKIMLNGYYGKLAQIIDKMGKETGEVRYFPGQAWSPMYASEITAGTRLQVTKYQNRFGPKCLAVHTDSVLLTEKLPESELGTDLGELKLEAEGDTILIACGQYELIGKKGAYKGIWPENGETWRDILTKAGNKSVIEFEYTKVESWIEAVSKGHFDKINLFQRDIKKINLNVDSKRLWPAPVKARDLLQEGFLQQSEPPIYINTEIPGFWNIKSRKTYHVPKNFAKLPLPEVM